jgi:hypothetical protein
MSYGFSQHLAESVSRDVAGMKISESETRSSVQLDISPPDEVGQDRADKPSVSAALCLCLCSFGEIHN